MKDDEQHGDADAHDRDAPANVRRLGMSPEQRLGCLCVRGRRRRRISVTPLFVDNIVDGGGVLAPTRGSSLLLSQSADGQSVEYDHEKTREERDDPCQLR